MRIPAAILSLFLAQISCGGTSGREDLPGSGMDSVFDASVSDGSVSDVTPVDATVSDAMDDGDGSLGTFDVIIQYADRVLPDVSPPPATVDAGTEAGTAGGLVPCTLAGQTGCVSCQGNASGMNNTGGVCSGTEAAIVQFDIARGRVPDAGAAPTTGCYACLYNQGCIDDSIFPDTGHECEDLPSGSFTSGGGNTDTYTSLCLATLRCMLASDCAATNGGVDNCYCGSGGGEPSDCPMNGPATNGACKPDETNGLAATPNDAVTILNNYTNLAQPSGMANQIFVCGLANGCSQCAP